MANKKNTIIERRNYAVPDKQNYTITLIIPCYNESTRLPQMFKGLQEFDNLWGQDYNIILVDDGSTDSTPELIAKDDFFNRLKDKNKIQLIRLPKNSGKGFALKTGVEAATGTHVLTLDADMSTRPSELINWLKLNNGILPDNEILIASRELDTSKIKEKQGRKILGEVFNLLVRFFTPLNNRDTQCGFKLYPTPIAKKLFSQLKTSGWSHDVEILYNAYLSGISIKDMPVTWIVMDGSKINPVKDSFRMFAQLLVLSLRIKFNYYLVEPLQKSNDNTYTGVNSGNKPLHRFIFSVLALLLLFAMPIISHSYGITGDEFVQKTYGEKVLSFFLTFGRDKSFMTVGGKFQNLYLYGGFFDFWCAVANKIFSGVDAYVMRHILNAFFGFLAIFFAGRLAKALGSWRTGWFTMLLLAVSPAFFGQCMNNPKDIPFAAAYMISLYFIIKFVQQLPSPNYRTIILLIIGIAMAISIRVPGVVLIVILFMCVGADFVLNTEFRNSLLSAPKGLTKIIRTLIIITLGSYFAGLLFFPYGLMSPITNPMKAFNEMQQFSTNIRVLFNGQSIMSDSIPWNYIPEWIYVTAPIIVLLGAVGVFFILPFIKMQYKTRYLLYLLVFAVFLPWLYAGVIKQSPMYDGWRQFLFIYPPIVVGAGVFWDGLYELLKSKFVHIAIALAMVTLLYLPVSWSVKNHPNEVVYFNELEGGINHAYGNYETDYYMNSLNQACQWFEKNVDISKPVIVATNCANPVSYYLTQYSKNIKVTYVRFDERDKKDWDYGIFYSRFIDPEQVESNRWISKNTIHIIKADNAPLCIIVKRTDKSDFYASQAIKKNDLQTAILDYHQAIKADSNNDLAYTGLTIAYLQSSKFDSALAVAQNTLKIFPGYQSAIMITGVIKMQQGNLPQAAQIFGTLIGRDSTNSTAYFYLAKCYLQQGYTNLAIDDLNRDIKINTDDVNAYSALGSIYKQQGNTAIANQYFEIVNELKREMHH
jgi:glycosyltransferase involved in cell wall biosynthesis/tetratricopeptide (TPR) repeat protein